MIVVPAFDPVSERWYIEEPPGMRFTARSLAELKFKLPPDAVIEGYYPQGTPPEVLGKLKVLTADQRAEIEREIERRADADYEHLKANLRAEGKIL